MNDRKPVTLEEAAAMRVEVERQIEDALARFEAGTGLTVVDVSIRRMSMDIMSEARGASRITMVSVEVRL